MTGMQPHHIAAIVLWYLMTPPWVTAQHGRPPHPDTAVPLSQWRIDDKAYSTAQDCSSRLCFLVRRQPAVVEGARCIAADDPRAKDLRWLVMYAPGLPSTQPLHLAVQLDPTAPISRWRILSVSPTEKECDAQFYRRFPWISPKVPLKKLPGTRCIPADELARAEAAHAPGWLLMMAPHEDVTAPLAQWTPAKEGDLEERSNIIFPTEKSCNEYRACLSSLTQVCLWPDTSPPDLYHSWFERQTRDRKFVAARCVTDDDPRLKEK